MTSESLSQALQRTLDLAHRLERSEQVAIPEPPPRPEDVLTRLELVPPSEPLEQEELWRRVAEVVDMTPKTSGRRFFNALFAGRESTAVAGEVLAALLNNSMYTYKMAGVQILVEQAVTRRMAELGGYPDGEGLSVPGGSIGNLVGLVVARGEASPELREKGHDGRRFRVYVSEEGHYSVRKNAGLLGIGRANVRLIAVDDRGRMRPDELERAVLEDRAGGLVPLCVVATAGTTVRGVFDPLIEIGVVARHHGLWYHVDAAWGGSFLLHPVLRRNLEGLELSDSFCWDAHKMMGVPLPCSFVFMRERGLLRRHFDESADYLFQQDDADLDPGTRSIQCGRRNDVLKLWLAWLAEGDRGWARRLERQLELARHAAAQVRRRPDLELVQEPDCLNVCFRVAGCSAIALCDRLHQEGLAVVGHARIGDEPIVRLVTSNPELELVDIERFFDDLEATAEILRREDSLAALPQANEDRGDGRS